MEINVESAVIAQLWHQLNQPHRSFGFVDPSTSAHPAILHKGWAELVDIRHILEETDCRAENLRCQTDNFDFIRNYFNLNFQDIFEGPIGKPETIYGSKMLAVADLAKLLMQLERLGFLAEPQNFVDFLKPSISGKRFRTNSEVSIIKYQKLRHKSGPMILWGQSASSDDYVTIDTANGYHVTALFKDEMPVGLRVDAPNGTYKCELKEWIRLHLWRFSKRLAA